MKKLFKKKNDEEKETKSVDLKDESKKSTALTKKQQDSLVSSDFNRNKLFKKGILQMADEKLEDAARSFELCLRIDPNDIEAMLKLGYARFHLEDYSEALRVYDNALEIDVTNPDAWNLKSLIHYEQKNYAKALDCVEKAIESDPIFGMAHYNQACYLSMLGQVSESIDALKRSIEIDVKNAKRAVKDKDFINVRIEEGFKRIIEVVVIESLRQGYNTIGSIVWTTFLDKEDALKALRDLEEKGLVTHHEKHQGFNTIIVYDIVPEMADKIDVKKRGLFGIQKKLPKPAKNLKELSHAIQFMKVAIEQEQLENAIKGCDEFIEPEKSGEEMIAEFMDIHRDIRLLKARLNDRGIEYIQDNKPKLLAMFDNLEAAVTRKLRSAIAQN